MKILMISRDPAILRKGTEAQERMAFYGKALRNLRILIFAPPMDSVMVSQNVTAHSTQSRSRWRYMYDAYREGSKRINEEKPDVITCQDPFEAGLAGYFLARKYKIPLELQVHTDIFSPYFSRESWKTRIRVILARWLLPKAHRVRVVSERIRTSLTTQFGNNLSSIVVLPVFVDTQRIISHGISFREQYRVHDLVVFMTSRLSPEKNIPLALRAFKNVRHSLGKNPLLLIVGEGQEKESLQKLITQYQLQGSVRLESWSQNLAAHYATADIFLITSNYEGYGRTVVEAMSAGLLVIMTDVGLAGEVLHHRKEGIVVPVQDQLALQDALVELAHDAKERKRLGNAAQRAIRSLPTAAQYLEQFKRILES